MRAQKASGFELASVRNSSSSAADLMCALLANASGGGKTSLFLLERFNVAVGSGHGSCAFSSAKLFDCSQDSNRIGSDSGDTLRAENKEATDDTDNTDDQTERPGRERKQRQIATDYGIKRLDLICVYPCRSVALLF